ncbi:MAG: TonB-dependent receptor plug domain-containing protein [Aurantibacter sp.]
MRTIFTLGCAFLTSLAVFSQAAPEARNTTICWDTSFSMADRNAEEELSLLDKVFAKNGNQVVQVLFFSLTVEEKEYSIVDGNWDQLRKDLLQVTYDGANMYSDLEKRIKYKSVYVFTDGLGFSKGKVLSLPKGSFLINSNPRRNKDFLNRTTLITKSRLIDRAALLPKDLVKNETETEGQGQVFKGTVYLDNKPASNIKISVKGTSTATTTNQHGAFSILARSGDSLLATSKANSTYRGVKVGTEENMKIFMNSNTVTLDEVILIEERLNVEEKNTAYGKQNSDAVGYAVQSISADDISDINTDVANATRGKFSGVKLGQNDDLSQVIMRPSNSILGSNYGLIVVDGVPLPRAQSSALGRGTVGPAVRSTSFLDPKNIEDVTVLKGLAATNRYGSLGSNGVLLITTKTAAAGKKGESQRDLALLTDNIYEENTKTAKTSGKPSYLVELEKKKDVDEAYGVYLKQREANSDRYEYFIDVFDYFMGSNPDLAKKIISNLLELDQTSYRAFRASKFKLEKEGLNAMAFEITERALQNFPDKTQAYLDMALAHKKAGSIQKAFDLLLGMADGSINTKLDFSGLKKIVGHEIKNMIHFRSGRLDISKAPPAHQNKVAYDARIVFEWNNEDAEFEIQFVNPKKRFFKWEHTNLADKTRINNELNNGFSSEQFEIVGVESKGQWLININYLGNRTPNNNFPTFIKALVQYDFGRPEQKDEEYLVRLDKKGAEVNFLRLSIQ